MKLSHNMSAVFCIGIRTLPCCLHADTSSPVFYNNYTIQNDKKQYPAV